MVPISSMAWWPHGTQLSVGFQRSWCDLSIEVTETRGTVIEPISLPAFHAIVTDDLVADAVSSGHNWFSDTPEK